MAPIKLQYEQTNYKLTLSTEKNGLSFIETSALDSTNVEVAFQNILTGLLFCWLLFHAIFFFAIAGRGV